MLWVFIRGSSRNNKKMIFLFIHENICCGYSLEAPRATTKNNFLTRDVRNELLISIWRLQISS